MTSTAAAPTASHIRRGLGWSTTSNLVLRVSNFGVSILMARIIAPEQFGVFAVALTVWSILGTLAEFGLGSDLVRAKDFDGRAPTVASIGLITSGVLAGSMALAAPLIAAGFESPASAPIIQLMSISLLIFGFGIVPGAGLQRDFKQGTLFAVNGTALVLSTATLTTFALLGFGPIALALGQIISQIATVTGLYIATRWRLRLAFDRQIAKESAAFCLPLAGANMLSWLLLSIDNIVVARVLSPVELGLYVMAFNISSWPMSAIGQAVRVVALPAFSQLDHEDARAKVLPTVTGALWTISLLMGTMLATLALPLINLLYGSRWSGAAAALVGLGVFGAVRVILDLIATFLIAAGDTRPVLVVQLLWLVAMVPAMYVAVGHFGIAGAGWAHVVIAVGVVLPAYFVFLSRRGVRWTSMIRACWRPTVIAVPTVVAAVVIARAIDVPILAILAAGGAALVLYVGPLAPWWLRQIKLIRNPPAVDSPISPAVAVRDEVKP